MNEMALWLVKCGPFFLCAFSFILWVVLSTMRLFYLRCGADRNLRRHGADIHLENYRGFSAYDLALPWLQKEMSDERNQFLKRQKAALQEGAPPSLSHMNESNSIAQLFCSLEGDT